MIMPMSIEVVYTTESTATGGGRDGHVKSADGRIDLDTRPPKAAGGSGEGTNPEQLFSAGYAAASSVRFAWSRATRRSTSTTRPASPCRSGSARIPRAASGSTRTSSATSPASSRAPPTNSMEKAHGVCPYSKATRGNIDVKLSAKV